jgi:hypothetical protein
MACCAPEFWLWDAALGAIGRLFELPTLPQIERDQSRVGRSGNVYFSF